VWQQSIKTSVLGPINTEYSDFINPNIFCLKEVYNDGSLDSRINSFGIHADDSRFRLALVNGDAISKGGSLILRLASWNPHYFKARAATFETGNPNEQLKDAIFVFKLYN
jgi:hypothetical protein